MAMMGSGSRGFGPDGPPPIFYFILFFMVGFCVLALVINFIHRKDNKDSSDVVSVYQKIVQSRVKGRAGYIANYLDKKNQEEQEK